MRDTKLEADILVKYLLGKPVVDAKIYDIYTTITDRNYKKDRTVDFAFRHPGLIPYIDAAMVFVNPHAEIRRRIHTMFAILETRPEYTEEFTSQKTSFTQFLKLILVGIRAVFRLLIGLVIVKVVRL